MQAAQFNNQTEYIKKNDAKFNTFSDRQKFPIEIIIV